MNTLKLITLTILFLCFKTMVAQSLLYDKTSLFYGTANNKSLVGTNSQYTIFYYQCTTSGAVPHYFIIQNRGTGITKKFPMNMDYNPSGGSLYRKSYVINDLCVTESGECYFCGQQLTENNENPLPPISSNRLLTDSVGFIGMFSITDVFNGTGDYSLFFTRPATNLTKVVATPSCSYVYAIGTSDTLSPSHYRSCFVAMTAPPLVSSLSDIKYDFATPKDSTEFFTDLADLGAGFAVASRFQDDHYNIGLRHLKDGPIWHQPYQNIFNESNKFNMSLVASNDTSLHLPIIWRENSSPVLLTKSSPVSISFPNTISTNKSGVVSYRIQTYLANLQLSNGMYLSMNTHFNLLDCATIYQSGAPYSLALLIETPFENSCRLLNLKWVTTPTDFDPIKCFYSDKRWCRMFPFFNNANTYVDIVGHKYANSGNIISHIHIMDTPYPETPAPSCVYLSNPQTAYPLAQPLRTSGEKAIYPTLKRKPVIRTKAASTSSVTTSTSCEYNNQ